MDPLMAYSGESTLLLAVEQPRRCLDLAFGLFRGFVMGVLVYGNTYELELDDRTLVHLQVAIGLKLRRGEGFFFSLRDPQDGVGTTAVWLDSSIPLMFKFYGGRTPTINRDWVEYLVQSSNSSRGMQLLEEVQSADHPELARFRA
jgi:hypothetical protein